MFPAIATCVLSETEYVVEEKTLCSFDAAHPGNKPPCKMRIGELAPLSSYLDSTFVDMKGTAKNSRNNTRCLGSPTNHVVDDTRG